MPSSHATWLTQRCRTAELWLRSDDGHVSILDSSAMALDWLREHAGHRGGREVQVSHRAHFEAQAGWSLWVTSIIGF